MAKLFGTLVATVMVHFLPIVVIAGLFSISLMVLGVAASTSGPIGLAVAVIIMSRYV